MSTVSLAERRAAPVPEIVAKLEDLLAKAKLGEIREFVFVADTGVAGYLTWASKTDDFIRQLGQIHRMAYRLQVNADAWTVTTK